tara:strand:+ start:47 stop:607 length:561 start_codon:yes stop_codon:yes gene_type:complete
MISEKIGNYPIDHPLAAYRCQQIADNVKFISDYEFIHKVKLDRERGDLKHFFWAFTCDSPHKPGYDAVKYCERHHFHSQNARELIVGSRSRSRRRIKGLRHEHVVPLRLIRDMLFNNPQVCAGDSRAVSNILKENLCSAVITREEALHIDKTYRTTMPENWQPGMDPFIRYELTGVDLLKPIHDCE